MNAQMPLHCSLATSSLVRSGQNVSGSNAAHSSGDVGNTKWFG